MKTEEKSVLFHFHEWNFVHENVSCVVHNPTFCQDGILLHASEVGSPLPEQADLTDQPTSPLGGLFYML